MGITKRVPTCHTDAAQRALGSVSGGGTCGSGGAGPGAAQWGPWLVALPEHVDLPFAHWEAAEVAALAEPSVLGEAEAMRQLLEDSFQVRPEP